MECPGCPVAGVSRRSCCARRTWSQAIDAGAAECPASMAGCLLPADADVALLHAAATQRCNAPCVVSPNLSQP